jgi:hypothetical protein
MPQSFVFLGFSAGRTVTLETDAGTFSFTGKVATLQKDWVLDAGAGAFVLSGADAGLTQGHKVGAGIGSFLLTGVDAGLQQGHVLQAGAGACVLTGVDAGLFQDQALGADAGAFLLTGTAAGLEQGQELDADAGAFALGGGDAGLFQGQALQAGTGAFAWTGTDAGLTVSGTVPSSPEAVGTFGREDFLPKKKARRLRLQAEAGTFRVRGAGAFLAVWPDEGGMDNGVLDEPFDAVQRRRGDVPTAPGPGPYRPPRQREEMGPGALAGLSAAVRGPGDVGRNEGGGDGPVRGHVDPPALSTVPGTIASDGRRARRRKQEEGWLLNRKWR